MSIDDEETEEINYQVKVIRSKKTGRKLVEEWRPDPMPNPNLKLDHHFDAARTVYDPKTGIPLYGEYYEDGEHVMTVRNSGSMPEHKM